MPVDEVVTEPRPGPVFRVTDLAHFGIVAEGIRPGEIRAAIEVAGLRPKSIRGDATPCYCPLELRAVFETLLSCPRHPRAKGIHRRPECAVGLQV